MRVYRKRVAALRVAFVAAALAFAASCSTVPAGPSAAGAVVTVREGVTAYGESTLDVTGPIPVLTLRGTPYEQGYAYGVLLKDRLVPILDRVSSMEEQFARSAPWYARAFARSEIGKKIDDFRARSPEAYLDEMRGVAAGAGIPERDVVFACSGASMLMACTSVLSESADGGVLHGRNFDFAPYYLGENPILVRYETGVKVPYWNLGAIGYLGSFNGCNDAGVSVSINIHPGQLEVPALGVPMAWKLRETLANGEDLEAVEQVVRASPNDFKGYILTAGSAREGNGVVFDLAGTMQAEAPWDGEGTMTVFNRAFGDGRHEADGLAAKYLDPMVGRNRPNVARWQSAQSRLAAAPVDSCEAMWALLRDREKLEPECFSTMTSTIANETTLFSVVFDLARDRLTFATGSSWAALRQVWAFDLGSREFSAFLDPDPLCSSAGFLAREKDYLELQKLQSEGKLTIDELASRDLDPYTFVRLGGSFAKTDEAIFAAALGRIQSRYPASQFARLALAERLKASDPAKAIALCDSLLAEMDLPLPERQRALQFLVEAWQAKGDRARAADAAARWLAAAEELRAGYGPSRYLLETGDWMAKAAK